MTHGSAGASIVHDAVEEGVRVRFLLPCEDPSQIGEIGRAHV